MSAPLFLTRARLRRDPAIAAIGALLLPEAASPRVGAAHQLVWSLFAGDPAATREFLWREDKAGVFYILSRHAPGPSPVFVADTKEFAPRLEAGDRLRFSLRANATRSIKAPGAPRGKRADIVMAALKHLPPAERAAARPGLILDAGRTWLAAQGLRHGFELAEGTALRVEAYHRVRLDRAGAAPIKLNTLDFEGVLRVNSPAAFLAALAQGFGHAKAFGCGLMLIRRI